MRNGSEYGGLWRRVFRSFLILAALLLGAKAGLAQAGSPQLVSRAELTAAAVRADSAASVGDDGARARNAMLAAAIRQRLRHGDFQVGDRVVVTIASDSVRRDTVTVRSGRILELPGGIIVPLTGTLRSELKERVSSEVLTYVKARAVEVTPLLRVGVFGEVTRPGFFALASDIPLTDAIMGAGGPTPAADFKRSIVRRGSLEYRSAEDTRAAIARGATLDQFGLNAGDELVIGRQRGFSPAGMIGTAGALASIVAVFFAIRK